MLPDFIFLKVSSTYHMKIDDNYNTTANILYSGYYQDAFNLEISDNGVYDFGNYQLEYEYQDKLSYINYFSTSFSIGFQKRLSKQKDRLFLDFEYILNFTLTNPFESNPTYISANFSEVNSVHNLFDTISLNRNFVKFGLSYNF